MVRYGCGWCNEIPRRLNPNDQLKIQSLYWVDPWEYFCGECMQCEEVANLARSLRAEAAY